MSILDLFNFVAIDSVNDRTRYQSEVAEKRAELEGKAQFLRDAYGVQALNLYGFNRFNPPEKTESTRMERLAGWALTAVFLTAGVLAGMALIGGTAGLGGAVLPVASVVGAATLIRTMMSDDRSAYQQAQMQRYEAYLDEVEASAATRVPEIAQNRTFETDHAQQSTSTRFQDMVTTSRDSGELEAVR